MCMHIVYAELSALICINPAPTLLRVNQLRVTKPQTFLFTTPWPRGSPVQNYIFSISVIGLFIIEEVVLYLINNYSKWILES